MRRGAASLLLALCCGGCFGSDTALYDGARPLTPFHAGAVTARDKQGQVSHMRLAQEPGGGYRLTVIDPGKEAGESERLRLFALAGSKLLVAEVQECRDGSCAGQTGRLYELVRLMPGGAEWRDPDCSKTFSKLSGVTVKIDSCSFADRASLEKALRIAATMPWTADGSYLMH